MHMYVYMYMHVHVYTCTWSTPAIEYFPPWWLVLESYSMYMYMYNVYDQAHTH